MGVFLWVRRYAPRRRLKKRSLCSWFTEGLRFLKRALYYGLKPLTIGSTSITSGVKEKWGNCYSFDIACDKIKKSEWQDEVWKV